MLSVRNLYKRYGPVRVLLGAEFSVARGQKVALVGLNGVGKSTLLRLIAGQETPDRGEIVLGRRTVVSYLPQELSEEEYDGTAIGYLRRMSGIEELESDMKGLEGDLGDDAKLERYGALRDRYDRMNGYTFGERAGRALGGLGIPESFHGRKLSTLSGGERRRVALAAVLLSEADLLLLDEPTNDLDLSGILFLESYLRDFSGAVIVASHDRTFLDAVSEKVLEIDSGFRTTRMWTGNYSTYFREKAEELRRERQEHDRTEEERERLRLSADEKREWARIGGEQKMPDKDRMSQGYHRDRAERKFGAAAKALTKRSRMVKRIDVRDPRDPLSVFFRPVEGEEIGIVFSGASAGYGGGFSAGPVDLEISGGSRIALLGRNGAGKSTILRMLVGTLPLSAGSVDRGTDIRLGVLSQENDRVPKDRTAIEWFLETTPLETEPEVVRFLGAFLLSQDALSFPMGELSPGERMRLSLGHLTATRANVLVLDEPTNHLDLEAVEALGSAIDLFPGTVILVSHDRAFLSSLDFDAVYSVEDGKVATETSYADYLERVTRSASAIAG